MWKLACVDYPKEFRCLWEQALRMREQLQEVYENKDAIIAEGTASISEVQQMVCGFAFSTCVSVEEWVDAICYVVAREYQKESPGTLLLET